MYYYSNIRSANKFWRILYYHIKKIWFLKNANFTVFLEIHEFLHGVNKTIEKLISETISIRPELVDRGEVFSMNNVCFIYKFK